jgi:Transposase DNA-binding/Transposase DDE domain
MTNASAWATEQFGGAALGDSRRTARLVKMAARAARAPAGRVSAVFDHARERQGAYDFLEERHSSSAAMIEASSLSVVRRLSGAPRVIVAVDGTSLEVTDHTQKKGLGMLGTYAARCFGVKLINSLAVRVDGVPEGLVDQQYWHRVPDISRSVARGANKGKRNRALPASAKETQHWIDAVTASERRFHAHASGTERVYVIDREADSSDLLTALAVTKQGFVVRSNWDRCIEVERDSSSRRYLREYTATFPELGRREIEVAAGPKHQARRANMVVRAGQVTLLLRARQGRGKLTRLRVGVVDAREVGTTPANETPLAWTMLTNLAVNDLVAAGGVLDIYALRWRVEEFHRTLKTGGCDAESMQLRSQSAVVKWATVLSAVATRIERLKHLSRTTPDTPATIELSILEIRALILLKREQKKRTEEVPDGTPSIGQATVWIAELGGYTGKSSGGPPGGVTIGRGLEKVRTGAELLKAMGGSDQ